MVNRVVARSNDGVAQANGASPESAQMKAAQDYFFSPELPEFSSRADRLSAQGLFDELSTSEQVALLNRMARSGDPKVFRWMKDLLVLADDRVVDAVPAGTHMSKVPWPRLISEETVREFINYKPREAVTNDGGRGRRPSEAWP